MADSTTLAYFPFFAGDWLSSTSVALMPPEVEGTYVRLLSHQWRNGWIPGDPTEIQMLTKLAIAANWKRAWQKLEQHFPIGADGNRRNERLELERKRSLDRHTQQVEAGQRSANARAARKQQSGNARSNERSTSAATDVETKPPTKAATKRQQSESEEETTPLNPPDGGYPPPPPGSADLAERQRRYEAALDAVVSEVEHDGGRVAIRRFLHEQSVLDDRRTNWVRRIVGWSNGLDTTNGKEISWRRIVVGINDLLDINQPGRVITPKVLRIFAEGAPADESPQSDHDAWAELKRKAERGELVA